MERKIFGEIIEGQAYQERVGVYGLVVEDNKLCLIRTPRGYFLPGGGIEGNETHAQCLKREFLEETGFEIEVQEYIGSSILYGLVPHLERYFKLVGYFYKVSLKGKVVDKIEEDHEALWENIFEVDKLLLLEHQAWAVMETIKKSK